MFEQINKTYIRIEQVEDCKVIMPFLNPVAGEVFLPGSKSITNRALILAALSKDWVVIQNALVSEDTLLMVDALKNLGFFVNVDADSSTITVKGEGGTIPNASGVLNVGNAGTVARFLTAMLCLHPQGSYYLDGSSAMRKRPMKELLDALESLKAVTVTYHHEVGHFPFTIQTQGLFGGELTMDSSKSSQFLSALFLIAPLSVNPLRIRLPKEIVSRPFIQMTLKMMKEFGYSPDFFQDVYSFLKQSPYNFSSQSYLVEPDFTAASYFFALALIVGGRLKFPGLPLLSSLQGDIKFAEILQTFGLKIKKSSVAWNLRFFGSFEENKQVFNFKEISDTFLTLAAIAPLFKKSTHIYGIAHTRSQETDRMLAVAYELRKLNQEVIESQDAIIINPRPLKSASIDTHQDHRMAMSFAILGSYNLLGDGTPWISIKNPNCCSKTFPNFFDVL
ncbi:hypothetical protein AYO37_01180, partial [Opitutia bacterium SCGC AG-212-L18]